MKRRRLELGINQAGAVTAAGVGLSLANWSKLENAHEGNYSDSTYAAVDRGLQWPLGTAAALAVGEPAPSESTGLPDLGERLSALERLVDGMRADLARLAGE